MADPGLAANLRRRGFRVTTPDDTGTRGLSDKQQIDYALSIGCMIASHNKLHFEQWHERYLREGWPHGGIILIPHTTRLRTLRLAMMLDWIGMEYPTAYQSSLFIWGHLQHRLNHGFQLPGYALEDIRLACGR
jgi:hypothetical protein